MATLLLLLIYIAFISLGLPDPLLGAAWPTMQAEMGAPVSYAGIVAMIIAGGTIVSSLLSDRLTKKMGVGLVTAFSVALTAAALFGFSVSRSFWMLCLFAVPYGLGAGAVDAALNNYVALRYAARHMNWLHCFWGVGAFIGPFIMGRYLVGGRSWNDGYRTISVMQMALTAALFLSLALWKRNGQEGGRDEKSALSLARVLKIKGVKLVLPAFFAYCALEITAVLWASSYLVAERGVDAAAAAKYASYFLSGITAGRFLSGFIAGRLGDYTMIRAGVAVIIAGIAAVWLPGGPDWVCLCGLVVLGFGCAPIYPAIIHSTPGNFGADKSQAVIGVQMASAYVGSTFMPPLFGVIAGRFGLGLFPLFLLLLALLMLLMVEALKKTVSTPACSP